MGFGWKDAVEYIPAVRAGEEFYSAGKDISHGDVVGAAEHGAVGGLNIYPPTAGIMEGLAVANGVSGGRLNDKITQPLTSSLGVSGLNPVASAPRSTPAGDLGGLFDGLWKNLKWIALIGGGILFLVLMFLVLIR